MKNDARNAVEDAITDNESVGNQELVDAFAQCDVAKEKYDRVVDNVASLNKVINIVAGATTVATLVIVWVFIASPLGLIIPFLMMIAWLVLSFATENKIDGSEAYQELERSLAHLKDVAVADIMDRYNIEYIDTLWWNKVCFYRRKVARDLDVVIDPERTATWDAIYHEKHRRMYLRSNVNNRYMPSDVAK